MAVREEGRGGRAPNAVGRLGRDTMMSVLEIGVGVRGKGGGQGGEIQELTSQSSSAQG